MKKLIPFLALATLATAAPQFGSIRDSRDGQTYKTVKIGKQIWMARNLNYKPSQGNSWCYEDKYENCDKYGRLYDWNTANEVCPSGWHLPTDDEWKILEIYVGLTQTETDTIGLRGSIGAKFKSKIAWTGTDDFGFSALPAGTRRSSGSFKLLGSSVIFWSSSQSNLRVAWIRLLDGTNAGVTRDSGKQDFGFSVRCLKNN